MVRPVIYDGVRLFLGAWARAPRGIDRVELLYARFMFGQWPGDCMGLLATPWGARLYDRARALRLLDAIETMWRESVGAEADERLTYARDRLAGDPARAPAARPRNDGALSRQFALVRATGWTFGQSAVARAPREAIYLNIGQLGWAAPWTTGWLRRRPDIRAVFMLHDVIPLLHPGLVSRGGRLSQRWMLDAVARHASGLITTTDVAARAVAGALPASGRVLATRSVHLPVAPLFRAPEPPDEALRRVPYFLVCGAIERRKNLPLLLDVWRALVAERGGAAPRLVVAGSPAHDGAAILAQLARCPPHIVHVAGLSSPGVRRLMANAIALLMPSLAEGFGLPIIESLAVGTAVLASDLPAHREVGGDLAWYLDPTDPDSWLAAIRTCIDTPGRIEAARRRIACYRPMTEAGYFARVSEFLRSLP